MEEDAPPLRSTLPTGVSVSPEVRRIAEVNRRSCEQPEEYWGALAHELHFATRTGPAFAPSDVPPYGRWFADWTTNLSYNCVDRWAASDRRHKVALHWEGEPGDRRSLTYVELLREVGRCASALRELGVGEGDRVTVYLPMIPEAVVAMLAIVRLGAIHSVVFGGFTARALAERLADSRSRVLITADGGFRRGKIVELKRIVDEALGGATETPKVVVVRRTCAPVAMDPDRDAWYHELLEGVDAPAPARMVRGDHPSFILYTSGTTGRPKGAVHSTAGYMVGVYASMRAVFDLTERDLFWCTADIGWVTGHSYVVYGPLLGGGTTLLYEGAMDHPAPDRWWEMIARHGVSIFYTSPTAIRSCIRLGEQYPLRHDLSSLRLLGTVGEPINPQAWAWYHRVIGREHCPIVDTWWQTETGAIMIAPQPGVASVPLKPGSAALPLAGVDAAVVDDQGGELPAGERGLLVIRRPWPAQFLTLWDDDARYRATYFARFPGWYYPADYGLKDADGYFWLLGRADEVMKVAGHRISTAEVEHILLLHPAVAESAVIGRHDEIKGEVPVACITLRPGFAPGAPLRRAMIEHVRDNLGAIAAPAQVYFVDHLPKTRSAKIMRRLIRDVVEERPLGDVTTLEDASSVEETRRAYAEFRAEIERERAAGRPR
jgi:acetyl-CoA synthetase